MTTANIAIPVRDVEQVLREGGLSRFHKKAILVTGAAWTFVAMEILLVGFVAPIFAAEVGPERPDAGPGQQRRAGRLALRLARARTPGRPDRAADDLSVLDPLVRGVHRGDRARWGPWPVMTFRFLAGIGLGGMLVVDPSMLTEYLPPQRRGRLLVFLDFWWPVGLLLATFLSWIFIGHDVGGSNSWRWLFLAAAFPAFLAFVVRRSLPESPYFLARHGRSEEAAEVLTEITGPAGRAG